MNLFFKLNILVFMAGLSLVLALPSAALAGGRTLEPAHPLAGQVVFTAWQRDGLINAAVYNGSGGGLTLRIALGTMDTSPVEYAGQEVEFPAGAVKVVNFPLLSQKTPRGDMKTADEVLVSAVGQPGLIGSFHIQNSGPGPHQAGLDDFLAVVGDTNRFWYVVEPADSLRVVFVGKGISAGGRILLTGSPAPYGPQPAAIEAVKALNLPEALTRSYSEQMANNFAYFFLPGEGGAVAVDYEIGPVDGAAVVTIPVAQHVVDPGGGGGGGRGLSFLVYDPARAGIEPVLPMSSGTAKSTSLKSN